MRETDKPTDNIRVLLADSQTLNLEGMVALLRGNSNGVRIVSAVSDPGEIYSRVKEAKPDILLVDASMVSQIGDQNLVRLRSTSPDLKIILLAEEMNAARAAAFAPPETRGLVLRTSSGKNLLDAIKTVASGDVWELPTRKGDPSATTSRRQGLSPREQDIAALIAQGLSNRDIAQRLGLSEQSVKNLVSRILKKKGLTNRTQIALERWALADQSVRS